MSRVQLALNVSDIDAAVDFYSKLFATEPAKRRPGYANFAIAEPPLKLVLIEGTGPARHPQPPGRRGGEHRRGGRRHRPAAGRGPGHRHRGRGVVLLRPPGQGVGRRARRRAVGDLHRPGRRRDARRPAAARSSPGGRRLCCAVGPRVRRPLLLTACRAVAPPGPSGPGRGPRHRPAGAGRRRLGHRRPAAVAGRRRPAAARERGRHGRGPGGHHPRPRARCRAPTSTRS